MAAERRVYPSVTASLRRFIDSEAAGGRARNTGATCRRGTAAALSPTPTAIVSYGKNTRTHKSAVKKCRRLLLMNPTSWTHSAAVFNSLVTFNKSSEPNFLNALVIVLNCPLQKENQVAEHGS